eukprot:75057_1
MSTENRSRSRSRNKPIIAVSTRSVKSRRSASAKRSNQMRILKETTLNYANRNYANRRSNKLPIEQSQPNDQDELSIEQSHQFVEDDSSCESVIKPSNTTNIITPTPSPLDRENVNTNQRKFNFSNCTDASKIITPDTINKEQRKLLREQIVAPFVEKQAKIKHMRQQQAAAARTHIVKNNNNDNNAISS